MKVLSGVGLTEVTVVVGFEGQRVRGAVAELSPNARIVENNQPETTGSMRSLALAQASLASAPGGVLVVEGDVVYGSEAVEALLESPHLDQVLLSSPTGAGDEVWVRGTSDQITEITKTPSSRADILGELVGLSRLSEGTLDEMAASHWSGGATHALEHYEERLSALCDRRRIHPVLVEGLIWGEVDDATHLERIERVILPHLDGPELR